MKVGELMGHLKTFPGDAEVFVNSGAECGIDNALAIESVQGIDANGDVPVHSYAVVKVSIRAPETEMSQ